MPGQLLIATRGSWVSDQLGWAACWLFERLPRVVSWPGWQVTVDELPLAVLRSITTPSLVMVQEMKVPVPSAAAVRTGSWTWLGVIVVVQSPDVEYVCSVWPLLAT